MGDMTVLCTSILLGRIAILSSLHNYRHVTEDLFIGYYEELHYYVPQTKVAEYFSLFIWLVDWKENKFKDCSWL